MGYGFMWMGNYDSSNNIRRFSGKEVYLYYLETIFSTSLHQANSAFVILIP